MIDYGIDQLVLGCTHYFIIQDLIKKIIGNNIIINNYNVAVASQVERILLKEKIVNSEKNEIYNDFYSNGNNFALEKLLGKKPDSDLIHAAAYEASKLAKPMDNTDMNLGYRKKMVSVFTSRALSEAIAS